MYCLDGIRGMNKKVVEISAYITCGILLIIYAIIMTVWSENKKEECIKNGGTVIDNYSVYDSCMYKE